MSRGLRMNQAWNRGQSPRGRTVLPALLVLSFSMPLFAQSLSTTQSTETITVGDPVEWNLTLTLPEGSVPEFPSLIDQPGITLLDRVGPELVTTNGTLTADITYRVTSFVPGTHRMLRTPVPYRTAEGRSLTLAAPEDTIRVESVLTNQAMAVRDLKPIFKAPAPPYARLLSLLAGAGLLALLVAWLTRWLTRRRQAPTASGPIATPYEIASLALRHLREKNYIEAEQPEPFYVELSLILRTYIEGRFMIHAPELTTEEFIRAAAISPVLLPVQRELIEHFLIQADLVKFARHAPATADMQAALDAAEQFLRETGQPAPEVEPA